MKQMTWLYLSSNSIRDVEPIKHLHKLKELSLSHNNIENIQPLLCLTNLERLNVSFNKINLSLMTEGKEIINGIANKLKKAFIDKNMILVFDKKVNNNLKKRNVYTFLYSMFIVTEDDLEYLNCLKTIDFLKRNVHLNLYYYDQIDNFLIKCKPIELEL
jgi:Leucine-rich repeat (LRR) protein